MGKDKQTRKREREKKRQRESGHERRRESERKTNNRAYFAAIVLVIVFRGMYTVRFNEIGYCLLLTTITATTPSFVCQTKRLQSTNRHKNTNAVRTGRPRHHTWPHATGLRHNTAIDSRLHSSAKLIMPTYAAVADVINNRFNRSVNSSLKQTPPHLVPHKRTWQRVNDTHTNAGGRNKWAGKQE